MNSNTKFYIFLTLCIVVVVFLGPGTKPTIDWRQSYSAVDKIPYGNHILYQVLPYIFPQQDVAPIQNNIYHTLNDTILTRQNYIFINHELNLDKLDAYLLLDFVASGNQVFMAAQQFGEALHDTLGIHISVGRDTAITWSDTLGLSFVNTSLSEGLSEPSKYKYGTTALPLQFERYDSTSTTILGLDDQKRVNFIKVQYGMGTFYLNCTPLAFTNYNMLQDQNAGYVTTALSHLPVQDTFWDEYYKSGGREITTSIRYILTRPPLKLAYYLTLLTVCFFVLIEGRRKQSAIPVISPLSNHTLEFVTTVGRLFLHNKNHRMIAEKRITYFYEFLRTHWGLDHHKRQNAWYDLVSQKTGRPHAEVVDLFDCIQQIQSSVEVTGHDLIKLDRFLEKFTNTRIGE